jgi:hypothetical protein
MVYLQGMEKEMKKQFRNFESTREFVRKLGIKRKNEWRGYCKSGDKPDDIPSGLEQHYKKEWKGWGDFLGTGTVASFNKQYRSFEESRKFVRELKLKNYYKWMEYCKSGKKPDDIPTDPSRTYKNNFKGNGDWLGTGTVAPKDRVYRPFKEAREFVRSLGLKNYIEWGELVKSGNIPNDIPRAPDKVGVYKKEWKGWGDFLGTGNIYKKEFRDFESAREFVRKLGLKTQREWAEYCKSGNKPDDIPSNPWMVYAEWKKK